MPINNHGVGHKISTVSVIQSGNTALTKFLFDHPYAADIPLNFVQDIPNIGPCSGFGIPIIFHYGDVAYIEWWIMQQENPVQWLTDILSNDSVCVQHAFINRANVELTKWLVDPSRRIAPLNTVIPAHIPNVLTLLGRVFGSNNISDTALLEICQWLASNYGINFDGVLLHNSWNASMPLLFDWLATNYKHSTFGGPRLYFRGPITSQFLEVALKHNVPLARRIEFNGIFPECWQSPIYRSAVNANIMDMINEEYLDITQHGTADDVLWAKTIMQQA